MLGHFFLSPTAPLARDGTTNAQTTCKLTNTNGGFALGNPYTGALGIYVSILEELLSFGNARVVLGAKDPCRT